METSITGMRIQRREVTLGEIDHVNVVPNTRAIGRVIIPPKDLQSRQTTHGDLCHIGEKVQGHPVGVLTDPTARVGSNRVEIAQQADRPSRV